MELPTPLIGGNKAHQPCKFQFPQREFGKTSIVKCSFQQQWFDRWPLLHYDEDQDLAFCFSCIVAYQNNQLIAWRKPLFQQGSPIGKMPLPNLPSTKVVIVIKVSKLVKLLLVMPLSHQR